jgi:hypothetical protein
MVIDACRIGVDFRVSSSSQWCLGHNIYGRFSFPFSLVDQDGIFDHQEIGLLSTFDMVVSGAFFWFLESTATTAFGSCCCTSLNSLAVILDLAIS